MKTHHTKAGFVSGAWRTNLLSTFIGLLLCVISLFSLSAATGAYWVCIDKTDAGACNGTCNCDGGEQSCCVEWQYAGLPCKSCVNFVINQFPNCTPPPPSPPPTTRPAQFRVGQCINEEIAGHETGRCTCIGPFSDWANGAKPCTC